MKCPICKKPVSEDSAEYPFCSGRCREVDLGNWAMEKYVISTPAVDDDEVEEETGEDA